MKRQIADLECREEAYMRTLQQADDLWCKVESDAAKTMSGLQDQLDMKNVVNQKLADRICELEDVIEQLRARLNTCRGELEKYMSVSKIEALIGRDDDFADVLDKDVFASVDMTDRMIGRVGDLAGVDDVGILAKDEMREREVLAVAERADVDSEMRPEMVDADLGIRPDSTDTGLEARPDQADITVGVYRGDLIGVDDAQMGIHPDDFAYEDRKLMEARKYLERIGSLSELDKYGDDYICAPDFICNDVVFSETGLTEEELLALQENRVTPQMLLEKHTLRTDLEPRVVDETKRVADVPDTTLKTMLPAEEVIEKFEVAKVDVVKVKPTDKVVDEIGIVDKVEIDEDIKFAEAIAPIEESTPIEEIKLVEDIEHEEEIVSKKEPTDEIKSVADIRPIEEISAIKEIKPTEEIPEDIKPTPGVDIAVSVKAAEEPVPRRPEEVVDKDNILIPRKEILSWQEDVDSIREMIAVLVIS